MKGPRSYRMRGYLILSWPHRTSVLDGNGYKVLAKFDRLGQALRWCEQQVSDPERDA